MMVTAAKAIVRVVSGPKAFGPTKQSLEIQNASEEEVTVFLERLGSEHFRISDSRKRLTLKPGASARVPIEFRVPEKGFVIALNAKYKAVIKVWVFGQGKKTKKELVDIFSVTGIGPAFVSPDSLHCFNATGSPTKHNVGRGLDNGGANDNNQ